jgi:hypothetical protein
MNTELSGKQFLDATAASIAALLCDGWNGVWADLAV